MRRSILGLMVLFVFCILCFQIGYADSSHVGDTINNVYTTNNQGGKAVSLSKAKAKATAIAKGGNAKSKSASSLTNSEVKQAIVVPTIDSITINVLQNPQVEDITVTFNDIDECAKFIKGQDSIIEVIKKDDGGFFGLRLIDIESTIISYRPLFKKTDGDKVVIDEAIKYIVEREMGSVAGSFGVNGGFVPATQSVGGIVSGGTFMGETYSCPRYLVKVVRTKKIK